MSITLNPSRVAGYLCCQSGVYGHRTENAGSGARVTKWLLQFDAIVLDPGGKLTCDTRQGQCVRDQRYEGHFGDRQFCHGGQCGSFGREITRRLQSSVRLLQPPTALTAGIIPYAWDACTWQNEPVIQHGNDCAASKLPINSAINFCVPAAVPPRWLCALCPLPRAGLKPCFSGLQSIHLAVSAPQATVSPVFPVFCLRRLFEV